MKSATVLNWHKSLCFLGHIPKQLDFDLLKQEDKAFSGSLISVIVDGTKHVWTLPERGKIKSLNAHFAAQCSSSGFSYDCERSPGIMVPGLLLQMIRRVRF